MHSADFRQRFPQQQEIGQAGGFKGFKQYPLIIARAGDSGINLRQVRSQRLFAHDMFFMLQKALRLGEMQGIRAGDINRLDRVALRHRFQRGKQMLDGIIICERLRLFKTTGVNGGEPEFAGFMGGVDKLARDPVSPNYSETYHKRQRTPERDFSSM
ncbi:Uncharacterised protein [Salmonella enterica subsp. enterica serovar Bovismorbificans]|uniref:Uncharacterized protein n=1 Tax=Salmonella enterica subsp. enterica serovar Bovismorbificans TaxID=58097 RepID=A0A655CNX4_SALET|nr:Uncharacterised protein [Salmonella enterica subsp. enterica serovar Bovismorbificans]